MNDDRELPPARLYKYRSFDRGTSERAPYEWDREIIVNSRLWAGSPLGFNDPFDCIPAIDLSGTTAERARWATRVVNRRYPSAPRHERRRQAKETAKRVAQEWGDQSTSGRGLQTWRDMIRNIGVVSLGECPNDMLMWGHYADSHRGYCIEFATDEEPILRANRVVYVNQRPDFRVLNREPTEVLMSKVLLRKAVFWKYEREFRIVKLERPCPGSMPFPAMALQTIIFGSCISPKDEAKLREMAKERGISTAFKRAVLDNRSYELSVDDA